MSFWLVGCFMLAVCCWLLVRLGVIVVVVLVGILVCVAASCRLWCLLAY